MQTQIARALLAHAWPILIAQLASIGMMVVDTVVLGHVGAEDLAAVAIGGGIHVSVVFALVGILQAIAPMAAQLCGAKRHSELAALLMQAFWLALALAVPGVLFLQHAEWLLAWAGVEAGVALKTQGYLSLLAWGLLPALWYRSIYAFCNALGRPRVLMGIGLLALLLHAVLASSLAHADWMGAPLGAVGCALSNVFLSSLSCLIGMVYLRLGPLRVYGPLRVWVWPDRASLTRLLRLGVPMGLSNLVEITAFTLISLMIAPLGATVVAGHRIVANLSALCYMLPLSLGIAVMVAVGHAVGAKDWARANETVKVGYRLASCAALVVSLGLWAGSELIVAQYSDDLAVRQVAQGLIVFVLFYQLFDAIQTVAGHALRAYHVTLLPMVIQTVCFWGIGLGAGWWFCYSAGSPMGVAGFWLSAVLSLILAAALLFAALHKTMRTAAMR